MQKEILRAAGGRRPDAAKLLSGRLENQVALPQMDFDLSVR
jgi:hypothetical protein